MGGGSGVAVGGGAGVSVAMGGGLAGSGVALGANVAVAVAVSRADRSGLGAGVAGAAALNWTGWSASVGGGGGVGVPRRLHASSKMTGNNSANHIFEELDGVIFGDSQKIYRPIIPHGNHLHATGVMPVSHNRKSRIDEGCKQ